MAETIAQGRLGREAAGWEHKGGEVGKGGRGGCMGGDG